MRGIALSVTTVTLVALTTVALRGDVVDAARPANVSDVETLLRRMEQLERRVRELEARSPVATPVLPYPPVTTRPHVPSSVRDGVLRADQVKIFSHFQRVIPDVQTAQESRPTTEQAGFYSGGISITR